MPSSSSSSTTTQPLWQFNEIDVTIGKDYTSTKEVNVYDDTHSTFRNIQHEASIVLNELLQVESGKTLCDFGCGTGVCVIEAAKRGLYVHGIDVSTTMLQLAQSKVKTEAAEDEESNGSDLLSRIQFHHAGFLTYRHLTEEENGVDYITTTYALHHLPDIWKQVALQRLSNLLNDDGKLHIRDVVLSTTNDNIDAPTKISGFVEAQTQLGEEHNDNGFLKDDAETHFRQEFSTYDWILEGMIERAGLQIVYKNVECDGVICTYVCTKKEEY